MGWAEGVAAQGSPGGRGCGGGGLFSGLCEEKMKVGHGVGGRRAGPEVRGCGGAFLWCVRS